MLDAQIDLQQVHLVLHRKRTESYSDKSVAGQNHPLSVTDIQKDLWQKCFQFCVQRKLYGSECALDLVQSIFYLLLMFSETCIMCFIQVVQFRFSSVAREFKEN